MELSVISIGATDMEKSLKFYNEMLEIPIKSKEFYPKIVELKSKIPIILYEVENESTVQSYNEATLLIDFSVSSLVEEKKKFKNNNIHFLFDENQEFPGGIMNAVKDPNGNIIELLQYH
ncbi:VOC family protein [Macrococcus capreoli]|uniref:VOC family protein n=1 Tax=Macrococcus capreoli TaxID=2982690 RepID=UPI003EE47668